MIGGKYSMGKAVLGAYVTSTTIEFEESGIFLPADEETSGSTLTLTAEYYIKNNVALGVELSSGSYETEDRLLGVKSDMDESGIALSVNALVDGKLWLEAEFASGETEYQGGGTDDNSEVTLTGGYYISQKTGLYVMLNHTTTESAGADTETDLFALGGDFYVSDTTHFRAMLGSMKMDNDATALKMDVSVLNLTMGVLF